MAATVQSEREYLLTSPLERKLQSEFVTSVIPRNRALIRLRIAIYLARTCRMDEAEEICNDIRKEFRSFEDSEVFVWIWIAQAVIDFYRTGGTTGVESLARAHAVAASMTRKDLRLHAAIWAAHIAFIDNNLTRFAAWLSRSDGALSLDTDASSRAALVAAVAWQTCGNDLIARRWFERAREIARSVGDRATIMASIANRASLMLNSIWLEYHVNGVISTRFRDVSAEMLSALTYESVTGSDAFPAQAAIMRIRMSCLEGDYLRASRSFEDLASDGRIQRHSICRSSEILRLWIQVSIGVPLSVDAIDYECLMRTIDGLDPDDAAVCWSQLAVIASSCGETELIGHCSACARASYNQYLEFCGQLEEILRSSWCELDEKRELPN